MKLCLYLIVLTIFIPTTVFSLQAPYLIDVTVRSEQIVNVTWRNNSTDYDSIFILRKSGNEDFSIDKILSGTISEYLDSSLLPSHTYIYALIAKNSAEFSDTSNTDTVTTSAFLCSLSVADTQLHATMTALWNCTDMYTEITYIDSFCDERELRIYCVEGNQSPRLVFQKDSAYTRNWTITVKDTPSTYNRWCIYYSMSGDSSGNFYEKSTDTVFTLNTATFFHQDSFTIDTETFISKYPIYNYGDSNNTWAIKHGDSIWIKESNTADSIYSVINVEDPANPSFKGYRTYSVPYSLPQKGVPKVCGNKLFLGQVLYRITDNGPEVINQNLPVARVNFYNDSMLLISTGVSTSQGILTDSTIIASVTDDGTIDSIAFLPIGDYHYYLTGGYTYTSTVYGAYHNFLFGYINNDLHKVVYTVRAIDIVQYFDNSKNFYSSKGLPIENKDDYPTPPKLIYGYVSGDSLFIKAKFTYLDTVKKIAYLILDSNLTICNYELIQNNNIRIRRSSQTVTRDVKLRAVYNNNHVTVTIPGDYSKGKIVVLDIKGRTLCETNITGKKEICLPVTSLTNGVYFIALQSAKGRQFTKFIVGR